MWYVGYVQPCLRCGERVELGCCFCQSWSVDSANFSRLWVGFQEERQWTTDWVVQLCHSGGAVSPKDRVQCEFNHADGPCKPKNVHSCCDVAQPLWWLEDTNQVPWYSIMIFIFFKSFSCTGSLVFRLSYLASAHHQVGEEGGRRWWWSRERPRTWSPFLWTPCFGCRKPSFVGWTHLTI